MKKRKKTSNVAVFTLILLVLFAIMVVGVMYWERQILPGTLTEPHVEPSVNVEAATESYPQPTEATDTVMPTLPEAAMNGIQTLNVLLIGEDQWNMEEYGRSDSIILCSIDAVSDSVTMVSFLRDIYLDIPGHGSNRINAAYAFGGVELLKETLRENFGVSVDATIEIDFNGYINMIDYLGGVDIILTAQEAEYLNSGAIWTPDYGNTWTLTEGMNRLTGYQTLAYSRIRYLDSDFVRTERQQAVLRELMDKFHNLNWKQMQEAMDCLLDQSKISMTEQELILYTLGFYPVLMNGTVVSQQIPAEGTWRYETVRGMSVIDVDLEANRALLENLLADAS